MRNRIQVWVKLRLDPDPHPGVIKLYKKIFQKELQIAKKSFTNVMANVDILKNYNKIFHTGFFILTFAQPAQSSIQEPVLSLHFLPPGSSMLIRIGEVSRCADPDTKNCFKENFTIDEEEEKQLFRLKAYRTFKTIG